MASTSRSDRPFRRPTCRWRLRWRRSRTGRTARRWPSCWVFSSRTVLTGPDALARRGGTTPLDVTASVFTPDGRQMGSVKQRINVTIKPESSDIWHFESFSRIPVPPGRYEVRLAIRTQTGEDSGRKHVRDGAQLLERGSRVVWAGARGDTVAKVGASRPLQGPHARGSHHATGLHSRRSCLRLPARLSAGAKNSTAGRGSRRHRRCHEHTGGRSALPAGPRRFPLIISRNPPAASAQSIPALELICSPSALSAGNQRTERTARFEMR